MRAEETGKLFQEFARIRNSKTRNVMGTGLGLSISRRIIEYHNGKIWLDPSTPVGARFVFFIPFGI